MARQKKDGKNISFYMEADIVDRLHAYAEEKGQSLTVATERIIKKFLDDEAGSGTKAKVKKTKEN